LDVRTLKLFSFSNFFCDQKNMKTNSRKFFSEKKLATGLSWAGCGRVLVGFVAGFRLVISTRGRVGRVYSYLLAETERKREEREKEAHIGPEIRKAVLVAKPGQTRPDLSKRKEIAWA
jgi:hypothetical protein